MILNKSLLLKCLGGSVTLGGTITAICFASKELVSLQDNSSEDPKDLNNSDSKTPPSQGEGDNVPIQSEKQTPSDLNCDLNGGSNVNIWSCTSSSKNKQIIIKYGNTKSEGINSFASLNFGSLKIGKTSLEVSTNRWS